MVCQISREHRKTAPSFRLARGSTLWSYFLLSLVAVLITLSCSVFEKKPRLLVDERFEMQRGELRTIPIEIEKPAEMELEVSNLDGEPLYFCLIDRSEKSNLENKNGWHYFTAFSDADLKGRFDSGWRKIAGPAIYSVVLKPHEKSLKENESQPATRVRLRVQLR
jgi:hypothetical protein